MAVRAVILGMLLGFFPAMEHSVLVQLVEEVA